MGYNVLGPANMMRFLPATPALIPDTPKNYAFKTMPLPDILGFQKVLTYIEFFCVILDYLSVFEEILNIVKRRAL